MPDIFTYDAMDARYHVRVIKTDLGLYLPPGSYPVLVEIFSMEATEDSKPLWQTLSYDLAFVALPDINNDVRIRLTLANGQEALSPPWPHSES